MHGLRSPGMWKEAVAVLGDMPNISVYAYASAINACGKVQSLYSRSLAERLEWYYTRLRLKRNLLASVQAREWQQALQLLEELKRRAGTNKAIQVDQRCYTAAVLACSRYILALCVSCFAVTSG